MAEFVQKKVEELRPVLEQMKYLDLFTEHEICGITKKLKEHEYKLQRRGKSKEDYLHYIQYLMDLLKLIKQRREKYGITQRKSDIDFSIASKINQLYKSAIFKFQDDLRFWFAYMTFCKHLKFHNCINQMIGKMLSVHQNKPKCWYAAAHWEIEENKNLENARNFLLRGLDFHPDSQLLYCEIFKFELEEILANSQNLESKWKFVVPKSVEDSQIFNQLNSVLIIYEQAFKRIRDIKFIIKLLKISEQYEMTKQLQNKILSDIVKEYPYEPLMWDTLARRELKGFMQPSFNIIDQPVKTDTLKPTSLRNRIDNCYQVYQAAVRKVKNDEIWSLFLDCMLEINEDTALLPNFKRKLLNNALLQAHQIKKLKEKYYWNWIHMLNCKQVTQTGNVNKKLYEVMCLATEALPQNENLWYIRIHYLMNTNQEQLAMETFNKAVHALGDHCLTLWQLKLLYVQAKNPENLEKNFQDALKINHVISNYIKPIYIEHVALNKDIHAARRIYHKLYRHVPPCIELHKKMISLEIMQPEISLEEARKPYEVLILQFGKESIDVWMELIIFEMKFGEESNVSSIYNRALNTLRPALADNFVTEFSVIKTNSE